jgi:hypothetical protein
MRLRPLVRLFDQIGAFEGGRGVHRHHHGHAVDGHRLVIGRSGAAAAAFVAGLGINQPGSEGLQLVDQNLGRQTCRVLHRKGSLLRQCFEGWLGGGDHRRGRAAVHDKMQQFGSGIVADRIHHPLALDDQAHVEIGDQDAFAFGERRHDVFALGRDDRGHAAAAQGLLQPASGRDGGDLLVGQPACGVDDEAAAFQRMVADRHFHLVGKDRPDHGARKLGDVDVLVLRHQGVAGERIVVLPAGQRAEAADGAVDHLQAGGVALAPDHPLVEGRGDLAALEDERAIGIEEQLGIVERCRGRAR